MDQTAWLEGWHAKLHQEGAGYAEDGHAAEFPPISAVAADMVRDATREIDFKELDGTRTLLEPDELLMRPCGGHQFTTYRVHMQTLAGLRWLNDMIINAFLNLLTKRS